MLQNLWLLPEHSCWSLWAWVESLPSWRVSGLEDHSVQMWFITLYFSYSTPYLCGNWGVVHTITKCSWTNNYIFGVIILGIAAPRGQYSHLFSSVWFSCEMWKTAVNYGLNLCYFVCFYIIPWCGCKICTIFTLRMVSLVRDIQKPVSKILEGVAHALVLFFLDVSMKYLIVQVTC